MADKTKPKQDEMGQEQENLVQTLSDFNFRFSNRRRIWRPPTDLIETEAAIVVKVEAGGMSEEDFSITFANETLFIAGVRAESTAKMVYHQMEIAYGEFATEVHIKAPVEKEGIEALYANGFLVVTLPKTETKRIHVEQK